MRFVSLAKALDSKTKLRLLRCLYNNYTPMTGRQLAKMVGVSHASVGRIMGEFHELDLVYPARVGSAVIWRTNSTGFAFKELRKVAAVIGALPSPLDDLAKTIYAALDGLGVDKAVLFGSVAEGRERPASDVDLFILVPNQEVKQALSKPLELLGKKCLELYGNPLHAYVKTAWEFKSPANRRLFESILTNGRVIIGSEPT